MLVLTGKNDLVSVSNVGYLLFLSFLVNLSLLMLPLYTLQIFDRVIVSESYETLMMLLISALLVASLYIAMEWYRRRYLAVMSRQADERYLYYLSRYTSVNDKRIDLFSRLSNYLRSNCLLVSMDSVYIPAIWMLLFYFHYSFLLASLLVNTLIIIAVIVTNRSKSSYDKIDAVLYSAKVVRSVRQNSNELSGCFRSDNEVSLNKNNSLQHVTVSLRWLLQIMVPTIGAILIIDQKISAGVMLAALILSMRSLISFESIIKTIDLCGYVQKFELKGKSYKSSNRLNFDSGRKIIINFKMFNDPHKVIEFRSGDIHMISGPCGSGKSFMAKAVSAKLPFHKDCVSHYQARYNDIDQVNVDDQWFTNNIGYIDEKLKLVNIPILLFVSNFCEDNFDRARSCCRKAGVPEVYLKDSLSIDAHISDLGVSSGVLAAIYLARLVYMDPNCIVIDNIDAVMDQRLLARYQSILKEFKILGKLIIICSHRKSLLKFSDQVHLLDSGRLVYSGSSEKIHSCTEISLDDETEKMSNHNG